MNPILEEPDEADKSAVELTPRAALACAGVVAPANKDQIKSQN
jgi:hypothetical protein